MVDDARGAYEEVQGKDPVLTLTRFAWIAMAVLFVCAASVAFRSSEIVYGPPLSGRSAHWVNITG